jgi:hypothetical protein
MIVGYIEIIAGNKAGLNKRIKIMTQLEKFQDFISDFNKDNHFLFVKEEIVSSDIAETIFLYGVKGTPYKIVDIETHKEIKSINS